MYSGFPRLGKKPRSANPGSYVKNYTRVKKEKGSIRHEGGSPPRVKLLPSTKPVRVELPKTDTSITGFGMIALVVLICFVAAFLIPLIFG